MNKMILSLLVLAFTTSAFAGNEGPEAAPARPAVLVERIISSGFVPPGAVASYKLEIYEDGSVVKTEWIVGEDQPNSEVLLSWQQAQVLKIRKLVNAVRPGKLEDTNPQQPGCMDAPTFRDAVYKKGVKIEIAKTSACKHYERKNATDADKTLIEVLDAVQALDRSN